MRKMLLPLLLSCAIITPTKSKQTEKSVYVCTGEKSVAYHATKNCRGLNRCGGDIKAVTLSQAKAMGRRACRICKP